MNDDMDIALTASQLYVALQHHQAPIDTQPGPNLSDLSMEDSILSSPSTYQNNNDKSAHEEDPNKNVPSENANYCDSQATTELHDNLVEAAARLRMGPLVSLTGVSGNSYPPFETTATKKAKKTMTLFSGHHPKSPSPEANTTKSVSPVTTPDRPKTEQLQSLVTIAEVKADRRESSRRPIVATNDVRTGFKGTDKHRMAAARAIACASSDSSSPDDTTDCIPSKSTESTGSSQLDVKENDSIAGGNNSSTNKQQQHTAEFQHVQRAEFLRIFIDDYSEAAFWALLDALNSNRVVSKVVLFRNRKPTTTTKDDDDDDGDHGQHHHRHHTQSSDDIDYLFHILRSTSTLRELNLWNFRPDDLASLSLGLVDHPSLEYVQLHMETGTLNETAAKALATMPNLISLELEVNASFPLWPLATSRSLTVLSVISDRFVWSPHHVMPMADRLERNGVLCVLDLEPELPCWCLSALVTSLRSASESGSGRNGGVSRLETLQFNCKTSDFKDGDACVDELLKLVGSSQYLRVVWNHTYESLVVSDRMQDACLEALRASEVLEQFHVFVEDEAFCRAKCDFLESERQDKT